MGRRERLPRPAGLRAQRLEPVLGLDRNARVRPDPCGTELRARHLPALVATMRRLLVLAGMAVLTATTVAADVHGTLEVRGPVEFQGQAQGRFDWAGSVRDA